MKTPLRFKRKPVSLKACPQCNGYGKVRAIIRRSSGRMIVCPKCARVGRVAFAALVAASAAFWALLPTNPTPIDDSLPSSTGPHSPASGSAPGKDAWSGPLWTT